MNILEQLPKSSSTPVNSYSSYFNFLSNPAPVSASSPAPVSAPVSAPVYATTPGMAMSDHVLKFDLRTIVIVTLLIIVILAFLGFNVLNMFGNALHSIFDAIHPLTSGITGLVRKSTGTIINKAAKISADVSKGGIDLAEGAVEDVGNIIIGDEATGKKSKNEGFVGSRLQPTNVQPDHESDQPEDTIQKSIVNTKTKWCLSGEYQNKRGCISVSESSKCLTGQVFQTEKKCVDYAGV